MSISAHRKHTNSIHSAFIESNGVLQYFSKSVCQNCIDKLLLGCPGGHVCIAIVTSSALRSPCINLLLGCPEGHVCINIVTNCALRSACIKLLLGFHEGHVCINIMTSDALRSPCTKLLLCCP